ncbi:hypothetical protein Nm8I071_50650 [Nonomuraea sp. TT08I-71]|nr:hypothetical protein Nm8I071_50650 [Nonomuraea sp. TT08I-71]
MTLIPDPSQVGNSCGGFDSRPPVARAGRMVRLWFRGAAATMWLETHVRERSHEIAATCQGCQ